MTRNAELFARAQKTIPAGVNSPVRAFRSVGGTPRFVVRGEGAYVWDADGKRYIDYVGSWGPAILGHAHPRTVHAVQETAAATGKPLEEWIVGNLGELSLPREVLELRLAMARAKEETIDQTQQVANDRCPERQMRPVFTHNADADDALA